MVLHLHPEFRDYEVSDQGDVWSLSRVIIRSNGRPYTVPRAKLTPCWNGDHWQVVLYRDGKRHARFVHHLVLETFVGSRPEGMKGLHQDDDPNNNNVGNLYWGTSSQNTLDSVRNGGHHNAKKTRCKRGHPLEGPNLASWTSHSRCCKACNRALSHARWLGIQGDEEKIAKLADQKFAAIMISAGED